MSNNYIQPGEVAEHTASAAIASGDVVVLGSRVGVALNAIANGETGPVQVSGVFSVAKASADTVAQGDELYWDATNSEATTVSTGNTLMGYAFWAAAGGVTTVNVKLNA